LLENIFLFCFFDRILVGRRRQQQDEEVEAQAEEARHQAYQRKEEVAGNNEVPLVDF
jgi:hypothetical protein